MRIIYIDSNGKEIITTLTADLLPFHTHDYEPKNENIQAHISDGTIHVTPEQTANFHAHSNKENLDAYNPSSFASAAHTHQWDRINFTVNGSALIDGIPSSQAGTGGTLRKYIGTYLAQKSEIIKNLNDLTEKSYNSLTDKPDLSKLDVIVTNGDGSQFLAKDGTYKTVSNGNGSDVFPAGACYVHSTFNDIAPYFSSINNAVDAGYRVIQLGAGIHNLSGNITDTYIQGLADCTLNLGSVRIAHCTIEVPRIIGVADRVVIFNSGTNYIKCLEMRECNYLLNDSLMELNIDTIIHSSNSYQIDTGIVNINAHTASYEFQTASNPDKTHFIVGKNARLYITNLKFAEFFVEPRDINDNPRNAIFDLEMASYLYLKNCRIVGLPNNPVILTDVQEFADIHLLLDNCILIGNNYNEIVASYNTNEIYWNRNTIIKNGVSGWIPINNNLTIESTVDSWQ